MTNRLKTIRVALWGLALLALGAVAWMQYIKPMLETSIRDTLGQGDYALTATDGTTFTADTLRGSPSAVFFGFTHCPDVCPTTLGDLSVWQDDLIAEGATPLRLYFVTVDPERDTLDALTDYVSWVPGVVGVTGTRAQIDKAIKSFAIYSRKVPIDGGGYTMDHSASILLFDSDGQLFEPIGYQEGDVRAMHKIHRLLAQ